MRNKFYKVVNDIFTGKDQHTVDIGRILWAVGILVYFALSIHSVWHGTVFDPVSWGTGFSAIMASGGAALWMKSSTEPESPREAHRKDMQVENGNGDHHDVGDGK
jgi:hypothetical protein